MKLDRDITGCFYCYFFPHVQQRLRPLASDWLRRSLPVTLISSTFLSKLLELLLQTPPGEAAEPAAICGGQ